VFFLSLVRDTADNSISRANSAMASSSQRKIFVLATAAGLSSGTHGGGTHLPFPGFVKHRGVMIGTSFNDENAVMIELKKGSKIKNFVKEQVFIAPIGPWMRSRAERERQEYHNPKIKLEDTALTTMMTNEDILDEGTSPC
jgi:hypothetical protein